MADDKKRDDFAIAMGDRSGDRFEAPKATYRPAPHLAMASVSHNPIVPILAYCASSILMTVLNKYVLSGGSDFNLNFFLLCVQVSGILVASRTLADGVLGSGVCHRDPNDEDFRSHKLSRFQRR